MVLSSRSRITSNCRTSPGLAISRTSSYRSTDSTLPEPSTEPIDEHPQSNIQITDERLQSSVYERDCSTTVLRTIPAHDEGTCELQVNFSAPTTTLIQENDPSVSAIAFTKKYFDIGISTNYNSTGPLQHYQLPIIRGFIVSLHEILKSDTTLDEVLDYIKKFTSTLVALGAPLDDWDSFAQYVLQEVKEIDNLKLKMEEDEANPSAEIFPFIQEEIETYRQAREEDADALEISHQLLHRAIQEHVSLTAKYIELERQMKNTEDACFSILKEVNDIEKRREKNQTRLESLGAAAASATRRLQLKEECKQKISALSTSILSRINSFSYDV